VRGWKLKWRWNEERALARKGNSSNGIVVAAVVSSPGQPYTLYSAADLISSVERLRREIAGEGSLVLWAGRWDFVSMSSEDKTGQDKTRHVLYFASQ
jgi:hypothetical protein